MLFSAGENLPIAIRFLTIIVWKLLPSSVEQTTALWNISVRLKRLDWVTSSVDYLPNSLQHLLFKKSHHQFIHLLSF